MNALISDPMKEFTIYPFSMIAWDPMLTEYVIFDIENIHVVGQPYWNFFLRAFVNVHHI